MRFTGMGNEPTPTGTPLDDAGPHPTTPRSTPPTSPIPTPGHACSVLTHHDLHAHHEAEAALTVDASTNQKRVTHTDAEA
jgi:hypothetical protein